MASLTSSSMVSDRPAMHASCIEPVTNPLSPVVKLSKASAYAFSNSGKESIYCGRIARSLM
eukprot:1160986-Pelagomonas_calceolata.AAC.4